MIKPVSYDDANLLDELADILTTAGISFVRRYHYYYVTDKRTLKTKKRRYYSVEDVNGKWGYNRFQDSDDGAYYYAFWPGIETTYNWGCLPMEVYAILTMKKEGHACNLTQRYF